jgi:hypothetical protein
MRPDSRRLAIVQGHASTLITRLHHARGTQLKRRYENASLYFRDLRGEQAERFGRGLNYLFNDWSNDSGRLRIVRSESASTLLKK